jgi:hypothetical protein
MNGAIFVVQDTVRRAQAFGQGGTGLAIQGSAGLGTIASIGTLIHYFVMTPWYWSIVLFAAGVLLAAIFTAILPLFLGRKLALAACAIGWIPFAAWTNVQIARLVSHDAI